MGFFGGFGDLLRRKKQGIDDSNTVLPYLNKGGLADELRTPPTFPDSKPVEIPPINESTIPKPVPPSLNPPPMWEGGKPAPDSLPPIAIRGVPIRSTAEFDYLNRRGMVRPENDFTKKERFMEGLKSGGIGALQGLATGGLGGALGGFVGGAAIGAIDPRVGARGRFAQTVEPRLQMQQQLDRQEAAAQAGIAQQQIENQQKQATTARTLLQNRLDEDEAKRKAAQPQFTNLAPGATLYDEKTRQPVFTAPNRPQAEKPITEDQAEAQRLAGGEATVGKIVEDSLAGRDPQIRSQLPADYQKALADPSKADVDVLSKAQQMYTRLKDEERKRITAETTSVQKQKNAQRRTSSAKPLAAPSRRLNVNEASKRYPGIDFTP